MAPFKDKHELVKGTIAMLADAQLTIEDRNLLTTALLDKLGALPVRARITTDESERILVDTRPLTLERAKKIRASARTLLRNYARTFVQDTVKFLAIKQGVHYNSTPEQGLFAKAILWQHNEEQELYRKLAGEGIEDDED